MISSSHGLKCLAIRDKICGEGFIYVLHQRWAILEEVWQLPKQGGLGMPDCEGTPFGLCSRKLKGATCMKIVQETAKQDTTRTTEKNNLHQHHRHMSLNIFAQLDMFFKMEILFKPSLSLEIILGVAHI